MRKFTDKLTGKTVTVSHRSSGNTDRIDQVLTATDGTKTVVTLQEFLSDRFVEVSE